MQIQYKRKLNTRINILTGLFCIITLLSCNKLVEVDPPINQLTSDIVFTSDASAQSTIAGLYSKIVNSSTSFINSGMTIYTGMLSDEICNSTSGSFDEFSKNIISVSNPTVANNFWANAYNYIYQANAIIEGLDKSTDVTPLIKSKLTGEAKLIRAFCHFYLINIFGDVPLVTTTKYQSNANLSRTPSAQIYQQIVDDLNDAKSLLDPGYPSSGRVRPNKWACVALLARVSLYIKDYANAEKYASDVINSGMYSVIPDLNKVFLAGSNEAIWQLMPNSPITSSTVNVYEGNFFIPASGVVPQDTITTFLSKAFDVNDNRKNNWISSTTVNGKIYYYPYKYKIRTANSITEYYMVLRLAEQYLIRAEARANQNNINGAISDLNIIRNRSGLASLLNSLTQAQVFTAIEQERRIELMFEWGHRWLDLKRTNRIDEVLGISKAPNWQSTDSLFPIPQGELLKNTTLTQNSGY